LGHTVFAMLLLCFVVEACATQDETDSRQCDTDVLERQELYSENWASIPSEIANYVLD